MQINKFIEIVTFNMPAFPRGRSVPPYHRLFFTYSDYR